MHCLDCAALDRRVEPAVAVCQVCGAGTCLDHAWVDHRAGRHAGMAGPAQPPTRRLRCGFCAAGDPHAARADEPGALAVRPCGDPRCLCGTRAPS